MPIQNKELYDVVIITDRNYGLYTGYATHVLGLKTKVIYTHQKQKKEPMDSQEPFIWPGETKEDYLFILHKFSISYEFVAENKLIYLTQNNIWCISYGEELAAKCLIFAISPRNLLLNKKAVNLKDFQVKPGLYLIGEKAMYDGKIFASEVYTGEANLVAQQIYKTLNNTNENITVHSTDFSQP